MARRTSKQNRKSIAALTHEEAKRKNIPTAEYQSVMRKEEQDPVSVAYPRAVAGLEQEKQGRDRDLDPQLVWRGKDERDWSGLVVQAPPLYIQEKVHPKVLIDDLRRRSQISSPPGSKAEGEGEQIDLFADFNGLPDDSARTEFYRHDANWSNRMILGDSLQVMASLAEREGLRGQVQCIYLDPPFGIRFNSNFQWSTTSRDVKDGNVQHITREAGDADFDVLIACAFNYDAHSSEFEKLGRIPVLKARMNADLHMADDLKNTGKGNLFVIFGEPDVEVLSDRWLVTNDGRMVISHEQCKKLSGLGSPEEINELGRNDLSRFKALSIGKSDFPLSLTTDYFTQVTLRGVDVFHPQGGEVRSDGPEGIACWFIDTDYNEESFFVRQAYFLGANDPYKALKTTLKAEIDEEAWATLHSDTSRPFPRPESGRIAVKVINRLGDEVMKIFRVK